METTDTLLVPCFSRLTDYVGLWSIEPNAALFMREQLLRIDLRQHVEAEPEPLRSAVEKIQGPAGKSIAVVKLNGLLMKSQSSMGGTSTVQARRDIRQAVADSDVGGILLAIDSPGGTVAGTDDLASEVRAAKKTKPVWAHIEDLGASAAYWVASQADRVTANSPTALVGSIGTLQVIHDMSGAAEKAGVRTLVFGTGALKGLGTPGSKITDEQAQHVQGLVNSVQNSFDNAVKAGRGLTAAELSAVRHGGVMTATEAKKAKLIDAVQPFGKVQADFQQTLRQGGLMNESRGVVLPQLARQVLPLLRA